MKIVTASKFYYLRAGLEAYLFKITESLKSHGHDIIPFSTRHKKNIANDYEKFFSEYIELGGEENISLYNKIRAFTKIFYNFEAREKFSRLLDFTKPDLVWGFGIHRHLSPSVFVEAKRHSIPVIHRLSDYALICPDSRLIRGDNENCTELLCSLGGCLKAVEYKCVRRSNFHNSDKKTSMLASIVGAAEVHFHNRFGAYINNVDKFIAPSEFLRKVMIRGGIPESKMVHIPIFIDPKQYIPEFSSQPYLVYFGRLSQEKGLPVLINAMSGLKKHKLLIIGDGPQKGYLENKIIEKNLENVKLLGNKQGLELARIVRNSRLVIVPSIWYDNSPNVILEAFALGKPVLAANIGGIPEYIQENINGILYQYNNCLELAEKIDYLMNNPDYCEEMGKAARKKVLEKYNPEIHYEMVMKVIKEIT